MSIGWKRESNDDGSRTGIPVTDILEEIVEQNLAVYRHAPSRLQEDVSQEAQVADDYRGRLVFELLQNADDAMIGQATRSDRVCFTVTDDALWVANSGRPLSDADVQGLCGLGASSKAGASDRKRASIGHKGLGFKSVLEITSAPEAYSSGIAFRLGRDHARPKIEHLWNELGRTPPRHVPAMRFPERIETASDQWNTLRSEGYQTAFCFPFHDQVSADQRHALADHLVDLPITTVLFLKHLEEIQVVVDQVRRSSSRTWLVERSANRAGEWQRCPGLTTTGLYTVEVLGDDGDGGSFLVAHDAEVEIAEHRSGLSGPAWDGVELSEVSVAIRKPTAGRVDLPEEWRRFHVFLPTQEPSTYPMLVNGAFSTDLSRQQVRVSSDPRDYNSHLIRHAAHLFRDLLLPLVRDSGAEIALDLLDRGTKRGGQAADLLHAQLTLVLAEVPLIPTEEGALLSLASAILPPPMLAEHGAAFRRVLGINAEWQGSRFPADQFCVGRIASIAADHGARALLAAEALDVLASVSDPMRSRLVPEPGGRFKIDPVLELCTTLWERAEPGDRQELEQTASKFRLFPVNERNDETVERIALDGATAFYPPRSARHDLPLRGLEFMSHAVCWGQLLRRERLAVLDERMKAWTALFDVKEFRFEEVMRAAVLPGLVRNPSDEALSVREANKDLNAIAAICQLAGAVTKADRPLRLNRLGGDRAMFNLSRLPIPCRSADGSPRWEPAYKVYFGRDWIGEESVESLFEAAGELGTVSGPAFLAAPASFLGRLGNMTDTDESGSDPGDEADDVSLDDDTEEALETDELQRWLAFLSWLGVNPCLRLVHFHDVDDESTGWTKTKDLERPAGWAFRDLGETWDRYRESLLGAARRSPRFAETDPYLYVAHDLDHILPLVRSAANDKTCAVATLLFGHIARHWPTYSGFTNAQVALVEKGKWPSSRTDPPRARPEELFDAGPDLWLYRLRQWPIYPTALGPSPAHRTWRPSDELERRFGRSGRDAGAFLPVLKVDGGLSPTHVRACCDSLEVRTDLTPSAFTVEDARALCDQLSKLYQDGIEPAQLRTVVRPIYRQLFELLAGRTDGGRSRDSLADAPLLADTPDGLRFLPAREVIYASVPGTKERSGVAGRVPVFVLEAEPIATAPLNSLFGVQVLEDVLDWAPQPGEPALVGEDLGEFRAGLHELVAPLLARISAGRPEARERDRRTLTQFIERVEPVQSLALRCSIAGTDLGELPSRPYFVKRGGRTHDLQAFLVWTGAAWPPVTEDAAALAMSLADVLEVNMVETFLAFIQADDHQRTRLLDLAGVTAYLAEVTEELVEDNDREGGHTPDPTPSVGEIPAEVGDEKAAAEPVAGPAAPRIPLLRFEDLLIGDEPTIVTGAGPSAAHDAPIRRGKGSGPEGGTRRAAAGTDLGELDSLGMAIAITYEERRLQRLGKLVDVLPSSERLQSADAFVVDVHSPAAIIAAEGQSNVVKAVFDQLEALGISRIHPGFDILTISDGEADRLIELKSSGVDAQVQAMSWNEWKSARSSHWRERFWLYLAGNLRSDLRHAEPFLRAIRDPFGSLFGATTEETAVRRAVQLRVREFGVAEELLLGVKPTAGVGATDARTS